MLSKIILSVLIALSVLVPAWADNRYHYAIQTKQIGEEGKVIVRLFNQNTGKTVWKRTLSNLDKATWSKDHHAFAVYDEAFSIFVWRAGHQPTRYNLTSDEAKDDLVSMQWSPQTRFLAFLNCRSGGCSYGGGDLWVLDTKTGEKIHIYSRQMAGAVGQYSWVGERRIAYKVFSYNVSPKSGLTYPELSSKTLYFTWH